MKELEQKAREIADRRIPPDKIIDGDRVWGGHNGQAEKWLHAKESALEALQLKQKEVGLWQRQVNELADQFDELKADKDKTIASLQERIKELEADLFRDSQAFAANRVAWKIEYDALQERCERSERELNLHIDNDKRRGQRELVYIKLLKDIDRLVYFDHVSNGQELQERIEQALTEAKGGEV